MSVEAAGTLHCNVVESTEDVPDKAWGPNFAMDGARETWSGVGNMRMPG